MNTDALKEVLKVKALSFTKEEIESIMDEELEKAPEEMDAELIDMCLDILTVERKEKADENIIDSSEKTDKKVKMINLKKGLLVAAIITILITIAIPVGAKIFDIDIPESMLKVYDDYFKLNLSGEKQNENLDLLLAENDIKDAVLPRFLFVDCKITDFKSFDEEDSRQVDFKYDDEKQDLNGTVTIKYSGQYSEFFDGEALVDRQREKIKSVVVNGIDVVIFNKNDRCIMVYCVDETEYSIELFGTTIEKALEIAETL